VAVLAMVLGAMLSIGGIVVGSNPWLLGGAAAAVLGWFTRKRLPRTLPSKDQR